ncbi:MAG: hypothetical protein ACREMH_04475 [Gemmatimonadales bacterium]
MWQRVLLDRRRAVPYLGALIAGCAAPPAPLVPIDASPVGHEQVAAWTAPTAPAGAVVHRFKWQYRDARQSVGGRGSARVAGPDSVRFDARGPLGQGRSSAVVVGDSIIWAEPDENLLDFAPNVVLMWAMFAVAREPGDEDILLGLERPEFTAWRIIEGGDTLEYVREPARRRFRAELRRGGEVIGRTETSFDETGRLAKARLDAPTAPARLDITFLSSTTSEPFAHDVWLPDRP